jgi:hypothetical protein
VNEVTLTCECGFWATVATQEAPNRPRITLVRVACGGCPATLEWKEKEDD